LAWAQPDFAFPHPHAGYSEPEMTNPLSHRAADGVVRIAVHRRQQLLGEMLGTFLGTLWLWAVRRRTRLALAKAADDPHLLDDIGLTRAQARREAAKWSWMP
jgi:uncharacterized protein YjiS (DUF1127 family)